MKTGTSALQRFLSDNREYLKQQGVLYPDLNQGMPERFRFRNGHFLVYEAGSNKEQDRQVDQKKVVEEAYRQIGMLARKWDTIVLSEELLWHYGKKKKNFWGDLAENLKKVGCDLKVIVYFRRQDALIESLYVHTIKSNHKAIGEFSDYINGKSVQYFCLDYYSEIKEIERQIGKGKLDIHIYDKERFAGNPTGILSDFIEIFGLALDDNYKLHKKARNAGLEGNFIEFKRVLNEIPEYQAGENFLSRPLVLASSVKEKGQIKERRGFFTLEGREEFLKRFEEGNRKLSEEYFGGVSLFSKPTDVPLWEINQETLWKDMVTAMGEMFCEQEKRLAALEAEWGGMKKELNDIWFVKAYRKARNRLKKE